MKGAVTEYMTIEKIAIRQEIRQMLNECGINRNTLKDMVKEVLQEELEKAIKQSLNETNTAGAISTKIEQCVKQSSNRMVREEIRDRVNSVFGRMTISVDITDKDGQSIITR